MNKKCPKCGYEIQDGDQFCINCGYKISQNNKERLMLMKKEKTGDNSTKSKKQPIKRMKELEATSSDLHSKQPQEFWKKKSFLGIVVAIALVVLVIRANILPKGLSKPSEIIDYCMTRNKYLNELQDEADFGTKITRDFGFDPAINEEMNSDKHSYELLKNKDTGRYVFNYNYKDKMIPSYIIMNPAPNPKYCMLFITPVKKQHIAGIVQYGVKINDVKKNYPFTKYYGYSPNDFSNRGIELDNDIKEKNYENTDVYLDPNY